MNQSDHLILSHEGLVHSIVAKYRRGVAAREDLVQEGMLGLVVAVRSYDPSRGAFSTHAYYIVWGKLTTYYRHECYHQGIPRSRGERGRTNMLRVDSFSRAAAVAVGAETNDESLMDRIPSQLPSMDEVVDARRAISRAIHEAARALDEARAPKEADRLARKFRIHPAALVAAAREMGYASKRPATHSISARTMRPRKAPEAAAQMRSSVSTSI